MKGYAEIRSIDLYKDGTVGVFDETGKPLISYHHRRLTPRLVDRMMAVAAPDLVIALVDSEGRMRTTPDMLRVFADLESPRPTTESLTCMVYVGTDDTFDIGSGKETRRWISYAASELELLTPAPEAEACPS